MQFSIRLSTQTPTHIFQIEFSIEIPYERGIIFHEFLWSFKISSRKKSKYISSNKNDLFPLTIFLYETNDYLKFKPIKSLNR